MFFIGCSSTYRVTDYPSKAKFLEDVNSSIKNRDFNVVTTDSLFTCLEGSKIKDDSLYVIAKNVGDEIPLKDIKDMKYYYSNTNEDPSAYIWLKNGKELRVFNVNISSNSYLQFTNINNEQIPLMDIKHLSYTNHWKGLAPGIYLGMTAGGLIGATGLIIKIPEDGNNRDNRLNYGSSFLFGAIYGIVIGAIVGCIVGFENIYEFNP